MTSLCNSLFSENTLTNAHYLSDLLPYDPIVKIGDRLEAGLREYLLVLTATEEAIEHLKMGKLGSFDPLVGENLCQIRAVKLALTIQECSFDIERVLNAVIDSRKKIEHALLYFFKIKKNKISLKDFLNFENCDIPITKSEIYLIKSFILTKTKTLKSEEKSTPLVKNDITDTKKIKQFGDVGSLFAKNFVAHLRQKLAAVSVNFIQDLSKELEPSHPDVKRVSNKFLIDHNGLSCLPCYWSTRIALEKAQYAGMPIVMQAQQKAKDHNYKIVDSTTVYFKATNQGYCATTLENLDQETPALILMGTTCRNLEQLPNKPTWIKELVTYCPVELVLAYAASHRQYPDESKSVCSELINPDYLYHKGKAEEWGCSYENPKLFFLAHAYCEKIKNLEKI